jgi:hypothetical protein
LDPFVRRRKGDTTTWFWKKYVSLNENQQNIRNCVLERTKNCHKKKEQNQKPTVCLWTLFLFDKDSNNLYFDLLFSFNDTKTSTNWWTTFLSLWNRRSNLHNFYFFPLYVINTIQDAYYTVFLFFFYESLRCTATAKYLRPWRKGTHT